MKNRFIENKGAIAKISKEKDVDVYVATSMYIRNTNMQGYDAELKEWNRLLVDYQKSGDKTLADFFGK